MQSREWEPYLQQALLDGSMNEDTYFEMMSRSTIGEAPSLVFDTLVKRFRDDLAALELLMDKDTPPIISDRVSRILTVIYAFTDASGLGFGDTFLSMEGLSILSEFGARKRLPNHQTTGSCAILWTPLSATLWMASWTNL
jgi:hypothetical protein